MPTFTVNQPAYRRIRNELQWRIGSYWTVYQQFSGPGARTPFSPTAANKWLKYVDNGYRVYHWTNRDFCRHFGQQWQNASPTACYRWMRQRYGSFIKAVARGKGNSWLVATTQNVTGRPFTNYNWWNWK